MLQVQEIIEGVDEDSEMLTSEIGREGMELNDILEQEGVDLPNMVENWKKKGMEHISEEEVKRINDILIARQRAEMELQSKSLGIAKGLGVCIKPPQVPNIVKREDAEPIMKHFKN